MLDQTSVLVDSKKLDFLGGFLHLASLNFNKLDGSNSVTNTLPKVDQKKIELNN